MKLGLKLWSTNTGAYFDAALRLYAQGAFDFIELYIVPGTVGLMDKWKSANIPFAVHAPHFHHGVNLADREKEGDNRRAFQETMRCAAELEALYTAAHPGIEGDAGETARQLKLMVYPGLLMENKPYNAPFGNKNLCRGATPEEAGAILRETGCGFCLDIGHAVCAANSLHLDPYSYIESFNRLNPFCYHISDNHIGSVVDAHMHIGTGSYDMKRIFGLLDATKPLTVETVKDSPDNLDDFAEDVRAVRGYVHAG